MALGFATCLASGLVGRSARVFIGAVPFGIAMRQMRAADGLGGKEVRSSRLGVLTRHESRRARMRAPRATFSPRGRKPHASLAITPHSR